MAIEFVEKEKIHAAVQTVIEKHGTSPDELIPLLLQLNSELGYLPTQALVEVSKATRLPISRIVSVASFYTMFFTKPRGRHVIKFCESAPCHVMGGREVFQAIKDALHINPGETTPDNTWTWITTSCLGTCGVGPVMLVDDQVYGNLTPERTVEILSQYDPRLGRK